MDFDFSARSSPRSRPAPARGLGFGLVAATALLLLLPATRAAPAAVPALAAAPSEDRIIVRLKPGKDLHLLHQQLGNRSRKLAPDAPGLDLELVDIPQGKREKMLAAYRASGLVEYAEPDYVMRAMLEPNDFRFWDHSTWHLQNNGIYGGTPGADIHAPNAWDIRTSAAGVIVAVIDTGIRYTHEDIRANLWKNPGETGLDANGRDKATNGLDDDGDGYIDDVHGINVLNHTGNPNDDFGHGTHVAGIIGAAGNNSVGIVGVAWQVQLMALKFLDSQGSGTISGAIECIDYARAHGAKVVNASWGSYAFTSQALRDAIANLQSAGILFVAACGNSAGDNDANPLFPASYEYDNIISVAATTRTDAKADFSNWGATTVDLAAPGSPIFSLWNGSDSDYRYNDGTSMAAPQVSGVAALVWAQNPSLTYQQVKSIIVNNVDPIPSMAGKCLSGGRLNAAAALLATPSGQPPPPPPPAAPSNLRAGTVTATSVTLSWTDNAGNETGYSIERAPGTTSSFAVVGSVGANVVTYVDSGLAASTTYTYRVRAVRSSDSTYSAYSNSSTATTSSAPPPPAGDVVWFDDAIPAGAWTSAAGGDSWNWVTSSPAPQSGTKAHQSALAAGYHDHTFQQASATMNLATGDSIFFYVYIDPAHIPREIMVSWNNGSWEHRAFWGENLIPYGTNNSGGRRNLGALPAAGQWVRVEVPARAVDLEGSAVSAMSFTLYDGRATWDVTGRKPGP